MSWLGVGIGVAGTGLVANAGAGFLGAQSTNRAQRSANIANENSQRGSQAQLGGAVLGAQDYRDFLLANAPRARGAGGLMYYLDPFVGNSRWTAESDESRSAAGRIQAKYPTLQDAIKTSGTRLISDLEANQAQEQRNTGMLDRLATQNEQAGQDLVGQEVARIQRDNADQLTNLNRQSGAMLGRLGINSLQANAVANNTRLSTRQTGDQILQAKQAGLGAFQSARSSRIGLLTGRTALEGELGRNLASARQATTLQGPMATQSLFGSSQFQPLYQGPAGGQSPLGSALGGISGGLTTLGAFLAAKGAAGGGGGGNLATGGAVNPSSAFGTGNFRFQ